MEIKEQINGIQHIGIPTNDIKKTVNFYKGIGFEVSLETSNEATQEKVAFLKMKNLMIETYENGCAAMKAGAIDHIAMDVTGIDSLFREVKAAGYTLVHGSVQFLPFWQYGVRFFTIVGPNQEKLEFSEMLTSPYKDEK